MDQPTVLDMLYDVCTTDEPFGLRRLETAEYFHKPHHFSLGRWYAIIIPKLVAIHIFLWLHNHHTIY